MDNQYSSVQIKSFSPKEMLALFIAFILSVVFTLGIYGAGFLLYLTFIISMDILIPTPWTPAGDDPAKQAWIETLKSYALIALVILLILIICRKSKKNSKIFNFML